MSQSLSCVDLLVSLNSLFETIILAYDNDTNDFSSGVSVDFDKIATFTEDDTPLPDE